MIITGAIQHCFSSLLEVHFDNAEKHFIAFEILRIHSQKASTKMATQSLPPLVVDKAFVKIVSLNFDENTMSMIFTPVATSRRLIKDFCANSKIRYGVIIWRARYAKQLIENAICLTISK
jgi:hypothetical protein